jgi:UDP-3-O-[3-hydroxymyristoyl] glucosamine N-acyltransferase
MFTLAELAERVGGTVEGDGTVAIRGLAGLTEAGPGDITFLANPKYAAAAAGTRASAVIVGQDWKGTCPCAQVRVKNPDAAFSVVASLLGPRPVEPAPGVHPTAILHPTVTLGVNVRIGPYCVIEEGVVLGARTSLFAGCYVGSFTEVGEDCRFYPHVSVRERTQIGHRVIVHNGAVIGSDGFGYVREASGWVKIPQIGVVVIGNDVEIGANVTIDRARFGRTVIGNGVKIDNLVQIAHNVQIGDHTAMASQVGISGSSRVGRNVMLGGQAGLAGHISIGDGAIVGAQSGVTKDVEPGSFVSGYPAMPLPELKERVQAMEKRLSRLEEPGAARTGESAS